jgi:hypothetical protein
MKLLATFSLQYCVHDSERNPLQGQGRLRPRAIARWHFSRRDHAALCCGEQGTSAMMDRRDIMLASLALPLAGCGDHRRVVRYKLTLDAEVDGKPVSAFNVVELWEYDRSFPEKGVVLGKTGEAIVMELRPGRILVALLSVVTQVPDPVRGGNWTRQRGNWGDLNSAYGHTPPRHQPIEEYWKKLSSFRGDREWSLDDLPDLVTFDDVNDPRTVKLVDPRNLEASFGPGVRLTRATIAIVDNDTPLTRGIEKKLPWFVGLKGTYLFNFGTDRTTSRGNSLAETLHGGHFKEGN